MHKSMHGSRRRFMQATLALALAAGRGGSLGWSAGSAADRPLAGNISPVHDPCIIGANGEYHVFCTGQAADPTGLIPWRSSRDLRTWRLRGKVFETIPRWARQAVPGTQGLWAPDISWFNEQFYLYYACSTFGSNRSVIGLATNRTLDPAAPNFAWQDQGLVLESHPDDDYNAIDPNRIIDSQGRHWLSFGSFWSGIKLLPLDPATGKPPAGHLVPTALAARPVPRGAPGAIEAPFIIERHGYYYLFVSFDYCCRGIASSYYLVVGRARELTGPYLGRDGRAMSEGYGTLLLQGNARYRGPGHCAVLLEAGGDHLVYHAYDAQANGLPVLRVAPITWSDDFWPLLAD